MSDLAARPLSQRRPRSASITRIKIVQQKSADLHLTKGWPTGHMEVLYKADEGSGRTARVRKPRLEIAATQEDARGTNCMQRRE